MKSIDDIIRGLNESAARDVLPASAIEDFLRDYWAVPDEEVTDHEAWDILGQLASDLEYYEAKPEWRTDKCLLDEDRAKISIRGTLEVLDRYYAHRSRRP